MKQEPYRPTPWKRLAAALFAAALVLAAAQVGSAPTAVALPGAGDGASALGGAGAGDTTGPIIQPGAPTRACTLGFLFRSPTNGTWYATTAGHCIFDDVVRHKDGSLIGPVVASRNDGDDDWALVEVAEEALPRLRPGVAHWTGPSGLPVPDEVRTDDVVCHYGWPDIVKLVEDLRHRCGKLQSYYAEDGVTGFKFRARVNFGDSGSPVVHYMTGQALGMAIRGLFGTWAAAIDVCSLLERFADHGYDLTLATAPYDPPPPDLTLPVPTVDPHITASPTPLRCL